MSELTLSFATQINALHRKGKSLDAEFERLILDKVNTTRECGQICTSAKQDLPVREWNRLTKDLEDLDFDKDALQCYLTFARRHPEPFEELREAVRAIELALLPTGLLPTPEGHGPQTLHSVNLFSWLAKQVTAFTSELKKRMDTHPIASWSPDAAEQFASTLQPMAEGLAAIVDQALARARR